MTHRRVSRAQTLVGLLAILWLGWAVAGFSYASAAEPITIREIIDEPKSFHLKQVTLQGTVRNVTPLDPYKTQAGTVCYAAYLFYLEDETSSINVAVYGRCGVPIVKDPDVEDGQRIELTATIQSPSHGGYYLSFHGVKVARDKEGVIQAVADRITPLPDEVKPQ
ncbi:MAG: OB-fold nucleic acid binding domain-containing protein [Nitrospiraceae bacterium]